MEARESSALAQRISYAFARAHGVLPVRQEGGSVIVLARADASVEGIAELTRVMQRPLKMVSVNAERFANEGRRGLSLGPVFESLPGQRGDAPQVGQGEAELGQQVGFAVLVDADVA